MIKLELQGKETELSLTMTGLNLLKKSDPDAIETYFTALDGLNCGKSEMLFYAAEVLYTGYLCELAKAGKLEEKISYEDFLDYLPEGAYATLSLARELSSPKKGTGSAKPSNAPQESESEAV